MPPVEATPEELEAGRGYERLLVPALFAPWPPRVLDAAGVARGQRVLDVACGTGVLARAAHARVGAGGHVVALDPAPGMLAAGAEIEPAIEWVKGTAEALPFEDGRFDAVVSQFGLMFVADRPSALGRMAQVLTPGGRLGLAVWDAPDANPAYRDVAALLDEEIGPQAGDAVRIPFNLGDADALAALVAAAGFEHVAVDTLRGAAEFQSPRAMVEVELRGWLPLFGIRLDEDRIAEILAVAESRLAGYADAEGRASFSTSAHVLSGMRPA